MAGGVYGYWTDFAEGQDAGGVGTADNGSISGGGTNVSWAIGGFDDLDGLPSQINSLAELFAFMDALKAKDTGVTSTPMDVDVLADHFFAIGGRGDDRFIVNAKHDATIIGGSGDDTLTSWGVTNDSLKGAGGRDEIFGGVGDDVLDGGGGHDELTGDTGSDRLIGGKDADVLIGGSGIDKLFGGAGADRFVFESQFDSFLGAQDQMMDFDQTLGDLIDVSGIDANPFTEENEAFVLVRKFTHEIGQADLKYSATKDITTLLLDTNGDAQGDFVLKVHGQLTEDGLVL
jgi:Ca2+-binding RTX toxin-like protein